MAVRGWVPVGEADEAEVRRHLDLRYALSAAEQAPEESVDEILKRSGEAIVPDPTP